MKPPVWGLDGPVGCPSTVTVPHGAPPCQPFPAQDHRFQVQGPRPETPTASHFQATGCQPGKPGSKKFPRATGHGANLRGWPRPRGWTGYPGLGASHVLPMFTFRTCHGAQPQPRPKPQPGPGLPMAPDPRNALPKPVSGHGPPQAGRAEEKHTSLNRGTVSTSSHFFPNPLLDGRTCSRMEVARRAAEVRVVHPLKFRGRR